MKAYQTDVEGYLIGQAEIHIDPLETKLQKKPVYLIPAGAVTVAPPSIPEGKEAKWNGAAWTLVESRAEISRKESEGRVCVNGAWTEPKPSEHHVLDGMAWIIPPEKEEELAKARDAEQQRIARRARIKAVDFNQITTIAQLKAVVKDLLAEVGQ